MSTTVLAVFANLLATFLPRIGLTVGTEEITGWLQFTVALCSALWIWFKRVQRGDITPIGGRK